MFNNDNDIKDSIRENRDKNSDNLLVAVLAQQIDSKLEIFKKIQDTLLDNTQQRLKQDSVWKKEKAWSSGDGWVTAQTLTLNAQYLPSSQLCHVEVWMGFWNEGTLVIEYGGWIKPNHDQDSTLLIGDIKKKQQLVQFFKNRGIRGDVPKNSAGFWRLIPEPQFSANNPQHLAALAIAAGVCEKGPQLPLIAPDMSNLVDTVYDCCKNYEKALRELGWLVEK